jgi:hypothetical protein
MKREEIFDDKWEIGHVSEMDAIDDAISKIVRAKLAETFGMAEEASEISFFDNGILYDCGGEEFGFNSPIIFQASHAELLAGFRDVVPEFDKDGRERWRAWAKEIIAACDDADTQGA